MRATFLLLLLATVPMAARADDSIAVPEGWIKIDTAGKVRVWVADKAILTSTGKSEFGARLREMVDMFGGIYVLNKALVRTGGDGSKFPELERKEVNLLLFKDDAEYDKWLLEAGKSLSTVHKGQYLPTVGFPLVDGAVPKERWPELTHLLSHVFIHHHFYFDPPLWINEGLAEYFAWSSKKAKPNEFKAFNEMMDRLRATKDAGKSIDVETLLCRRDEPFSREETDAAWVLVHLFATELNAIFSDLTMAMGNLELMAMDGEKAIVDDLHRLARYLATRPFGGDRGLAGAWANHRDALLVSPTMPAKLREKPKTAVEAAGPFLAVAFSSYKHFYQDASGFQRKEAPFTGGVRPCLPWAGKLTVHGALGDSGDNWTEDYAVIEGFSNESCATLSFKDKDLPCGDQARNARLTVWWQPNGGGLYRVVKIEKLSRSK